MRNAKVSIFGNFGTVNVGNECTLQAVIYNVHKFVAGGEINCICSNPRDVMVRHNIPAVHMARPIHEVHQCPATRKSGTLLSRVLRILLMRLPGELGEWIRALRVLNGRTMLLVTGTGVLTDRGEGLFGLPYQIFKWVVSAKLCKLRVLFLSVGVEPISRRSTKWFIEASLALADHISYRDDHSKQYLATMGINQTSSIYPDMAFSLPESALPACSRAASTTPVIGVGVFDYCRTDLERNGTAQSRYKEYIQKVSTFIVWLLDNGYQVRILIGDVTYDNAVRNDLRTVLENVGITYAGRTILDEPISSVSDLLQQIATTDMVVATRFHNVLLALMLNKPVISISYDRKNDSLMEAVGLSNYCQNIEKLDVSRLITQFTKLRENGDRLKTQIKERVHEHRVASLKQYSVIFANGGIT